METIRNTLDNIFTGFYSVEQRGDQFEVVTAYNINTITFNKGVVKVIRVERNK